MPRRKPLPSERDSRGDRRRQDLLKAAFRVVAEKGLEGLRTRDVAARAGVNISTLHYYFGTKQALVIATLEHALELFTGGHGEAVPNTSADSLYGHFASAWRTFQANPGLDTVLLELVVRAHRDPAVRAAFRKTYRNWNGEVERVLRVSTEQGSLRRDIAEPLGAIATTSTIMGAIIQLAVNPRGFRFTEVAAEFVRWLDREPATRVPRK
jgi:AcrR family transcriptional regulator